MGKIEEQIEKYKSECAATCDRKGKFSKLHEELVQERRDVMLKPIMDGLEGKKLKTAMSKRTTALNKHVKESTVVHEYNKCALTQCRQNIKELLAAFIETYEADAQTAKGEYKNWLEYKIKEMKKIYNSRSDAVLSAFLLRMASTEYDLLF